MDLGLFTLIILEGEYHHLGAGHIVREFAELFLQRIAYHRISILVHEAEALLCGERIRSILEKLGDDIPNGGGIGSKIQLVIGRARGRLVGRTRDPTFGQLAGRARARMETVL